MADSNKNDVKRSPSKCMIGPKVDKDDTQDISEATDVGEEELTPEDAEHEDTDSDMLLASLTNDSRASSNTLNLCCRKVSKIYLSFISLCVLIRFFILC